ncbi:MAG: ABC transporter ATP-binding protein [Marinifilaceae bacterium]
MNKIIECNNLTHYYGERKIYENLSFSVEEGKILGLLGKNGTGKTTTINILNGYLQARSGQCLLFGEDSQHLSPSTRQRIALLLEGHVQYAFMNVEQIERFYAPFFPQWNREVYYELMRKLKVAPRQAISRMSCGQRSQVALGLILAQNAELLILDDFSLGLDPGYRRLFIEYLKEYAGAERKTMFLTSHIIQDLELLIDDCIIMDYGGIKVQRPVKELSETFRRFTFESANEWQAPAEHFHSTSQRGNRVETYSFLSTEEVRNAIGTGVSVTEERLSLEDIFIGLTGKY